MKARYGKVAVLMGGMSAEREISLKSGRAVLKALQEKGVDAHGVDVGEDVVHQLISGGYDRVFNMLHGRIGEDGVIQGALELLGLPYTGSKVLASAIGMDKLRTKEIWIANNLPTPAFIVATKETDPAEIMEALEFPIIIKPLREGSSIGMSKVSSADQLEPALNNAFQYDQHALIEAWVEGMEYTAAILCDQALPLIRLEPAADFYDYDAKYLSDETKYHCPCGLDDDTEFELKALAQKAFDAVGAEGWGRVDMMRNERGETFLIEVNTLPGMTDHSLVPMAARVAGMEFNELVLKILDCSMRDE
ncbi:MAG: D-alanine--D-alanine ligase [Gammaproteobacteria bacterium]|nr:D-alanine--D-alanine ligase [Gammaproteobacteria bacterium]